ncbi:DUF580-domain-containing protein [Rozella allomycis CSF55]|uniref:Protein PNS1 n=1 Tax=Rozella allomycis (strain CSF55) TaxID=988480 RepID=A0A4P9YKZ6_ROZAC|nr:DUF580-domain-containing protein [Rozella allomycis CSF55]
MAAIAVFAFKKGDINRLKYGIDSEGNLCGSLNDGDSPFKDQRGNTKLFYFIPTGTLNISKTYKRCISECPTSTSDIICKYGTATPSNSIALTNAIANGICSVGVKAKSVMNRCIPIEMQTPGSNGPSTVDSVLSAAFGKEINSRNLATKIFESIYESWKWILVCCGVAIVISFLWLFLIQLFCAPVVWLTVLLLLIVTGGSTAYLFFLWWRLKSGQSLVLRGFDPSGFMETLNLDNQNVLLGVSIISAVATLLIWCAICFSRKRIKLAIQLIKEASKAVRAMPSMVFFPLFTNALILIVGAFCILIIVYLSTDGELIAQKVNSLQNEYTGSSFQSDTVLNYLIIYYVFGMFWNLNLISAIGQCSIAGAVATWYWTRDKKAIPSFAVFGALKRTLRYHLGSLALGSLILAIIQTIQFILYQLEKKVKNSQNKFAKYVLRCLQCLFFCLERFIRFLNKNAYIEIAVYGYSFCKAARVAFELLLRNAFRVAIIDKIGDFILFLGILLISGLSTIVGMFLLQTYSDIAEFYVAPLIIIFILSFYIASLFTSVFEMAIDTIFLSFCEDCERNDGSSKPFFMPESLKQFISKNSQEAPMVGDAGNKEQENEQQK